MIAVLILEDEKKVCQLLTEALKKEGYSFMDEAESGGIVKIVKKVNGITPSLGEKILELKSLLLKTEEGHVYKALLEEIEKPLIESILERVEGNQLRTARILGINRNTLRAKMKRLGIYSRYCKTC